MSKDHKNLIITVSQFGVCISHSNGVPLKKNYALVAVSKILETLSSPYYEMYRFEMNIDGDCDENQFKGDE